MAAAYIRYRYKLVKILVFSWLYYYETAMVLRDENGRSPLHIVLANDNVRLGTIKLVVEGNESSVMVSDNDGAFPLHIACQFCSVDVVKFLLEANDEMLYRLDVNDNSTLHYACLGGNYNLVKFLLNRMNMRYVSEENRDGKLPLHLLLESEAANHDGVEFIEATWLLLVAYPETVSLELGRLLRSEMKDMKNTTEATTKKERADLLSDSLERELKVEVIELKEKLAQQQAMNTLLQGDVARHKAEVERLKEMIRAMNELGEDRYEDQPTCGEEIKQER